MRRSEISIMEASLRWGASLAGVWMLVAAGTLVAAGASLSWSLSWSVAIFLFFSLTMNAVTWSLFAWDKRQAVMQSPRISEATLHTLTLLGGGSGAMLAQRWLRHKSQKVGFQIAAWVGMLLQLLALLVVVRRF